jgi:pimeloyl-ACP methyl ester carboxylesterase
MRKNIFVGAHRIAVSSFGRGKTPLVLLHGFCENQAVWRTILPKMTNKRVILIDLPGFGESDMLPKGAQMTDFADILQQVFQQLNVEKVVLVGHSMGGYVALAFAEKFPKMLVGLGLFHSHPFEDSPERKGFRQKAIEFIRQNGLELYCRQLFPALFAPGFSEKNPEPLQTLTQIARKFDPEGVIRAIEAMINRTDLKAVLKKISCPVLFVVGEKDGLLPTDQLLAQTHLAKRADIHFLKNIGHMGMFEATNETARIFLNFIEFCKKCSKMT